LRDERTEKKVLGRAMLYPTFFEEVGKTPRGEKLASCIQNDVRAAKISQGVKKQLASIKAVP